MRSWKNKKNEAGRKNVCQMTARCRRKKLPIAESHRVTRFKIIVDKMEINSFPRVVQMINLAI